MIKNVLLLNKVNQKYLPKKKFFFVLGYKNYLSLILNKKLNTPFINIKFSQKDENSLNHICNLKKNIKTYNYFANILSNALNQHHNLSYSKKNWELIIGHWLLRFIGIVSSHYHTIRFVKKKYLVDSIMMPSLTSKEFYSMTAQDSFDFSKKIKTEIWNEALFGKINNITKTFKIINYPYKQRKKVIKVNFKIKNFIKKVLNYFPLNIKNNLFIYDGYLPKYIQILLKLKLFNFPSLDSIP